MRISFPWPVVLDHLATRTRRERDRFRQTNALHFFSFHNVYPVDWLGGSLKDSIGSARSYALAGLKRVTGDE
jgi:hypothetical protein